MCSSNQICWGSDRRGDLGVMRKWKCLLGAEEQRSAVVETQWHRGRRPCQRVVPLSVGPPSAVVKGSEDS